MKKLMIILTVTLLSACAATGKYDPPCACKDKVYQGSIYG